MLQNFPILSNTYCNSNKQVVKVNTTFDFLVLFLDIKDIIYLGKGPHRLLYFIFLSIYRILSESNVASSVYLCL